MRKTVLFLLVCAMGLFTPGMAAFATGSDWTIVDSPNRVGEETVDFLTNVTCVTDSDCWSVGYHSAGRYTGGVLLQTLIEHWDGTAWSVVESPNADVFTTNTLSDVACASASDCWAVGSYAVGSRNSRTLIVHWDGSSWTIADSADPSDSSYLHGVSCVTASDCWAAGYWFDAASNSSKTLLEHWDGTEWTVVDSPNAAQNSPLNASFGDSSVLYDVDCVSGSDCVAVGTYFDGLTSATLALRWDGTTWQLVDSPSIPAVASNTFYSVTCISASDCWAVGEYRAAEVTQGLIAHWDGTAWQLVPSPVVPGSNGLYGVTCVSSSECWAAGASQLGPSGLFLAPSSGKTVLARWDGIRWSTVESPNAGPLQLSVVSGVDCVSSSACWAVGYSTDFAFATLTEFWDGETWTIVDSPNAYQAADSPLSDVACLSASDCWAVGFDHAGNARQALIERWDGSEWTIFAGPTRSPDHDHYLSDISCVSSSLCWAVGREFTTGAAWQTFVERWDGSEWTIEASPNTSTSITNELSAVTCLSATDCWAVGQSGPWAGSNRDTLILRWDGEAWTIMSSPNDVDSTINVLSDVTCVSETECWAVGHSADQHPVNGGITRPLIERWDGSSWTIVELSGAVDRPHTSLKGVTCDSVSLCFAVGSTSPGDADPRGFIARWEGSSWDVLGSSGGHDGTPNSFNSVACRTSSECFAVGSLSQGSDEQTYIQRWDGTSWTIYPSPSADSQGSVLSGVTCWSSGCWSVGHHNAGPIAQTLTTVYGESGSSSPSPSGSPQSPTPTPTSTPAQDPDARGTYPLEPNDPLFAASSDSPLDNQFLPQQWAPKKIFAAEAWQEQRATGHGIRVAVLDSGVDLQHEDFQCTGKLDVVTDSDLVDMDSDPDDENGHGTHVAGIIGACTNNDIGIAGIAPDITIMPIRVSDADGAGTDAQLTAGINRAVAAGAHVINMSLGYPPGKEIINNVSEIDAAIEAASEAGVVLVGAAGNQTVPLCAYPALAEDIVCVGATDPRDAKSWYSNFPAKIDPDDVVGPALVAPGGTGQVFCDVHSEEILSTYPSELDGCDEVPLLDGYRDLNGTSMAAPHVAGVAALVYDRLGGKRDAGTAQAVINAIIESADDLGTPGYDPVFGEGRVNALAAVQAVDIGPDPTPTPTVTATPTTDPSESPTTDPSSTPTDDPSSTPTDDPTTDPGPTTPAAPSNVTARSASSSRIEIAWTDNSNNETGFTIERSLDGSEWQEVATAGGDSTFHLDMGLNPDTSYFYRVRALNPAGYSGYSNTASATTMRDQGPGGGPNQAPTGPANLDATSSSPSRIDLTWADTSNNEDGFALERSRDAGSTWQEIATTGRNQTSYLDTGLSANTSYSYRVRAYNSVGHSTYSDVVEATTQKAPANGGEPSPEPTESSEPVEPVAVGTATTSIAASRELIGFKKGVELSGVVQRDDNCTGPLEIEVSRRIHGTNSYKSLGSTPVNGAGAWGLQVKGKRNAAYLAQIKETDGCQGEASVPTDVLVRAKIAVKIPNSCRGPIRGRVRPANEGEVVLQRRAKRRWNEIASKSLNDRSRYLIKAKRCGKYRLVWAEDGAPNEPATRRFRI